MGRSVMLNVRMDDELKTEAIKVLASFGLTASDAVRMFFTRIVRDQEFPMELKVPNDETIAAMKESDEIFRTGAFRFKTPQELFDALDRIADRK